MIFTYAWQSVLQWGAKKPVLPCAGCVVDQISLPKWGFSEQWHLLGPFQIGTREAAWGADPLELHGGFRSLEYDEKTTFRSSLASNGSVTWSTVNATLSTSASFFAGAELHVYFPAIEWQTLRDTYGWAALQWQAWARGEIYVRTDQTKTLAFDSPSVLEYWIDGEHFFGGDFYSYGRASNVLHLEPGTHRIDVRIVRDVRSMGGAVDATSDVSLKLNAPIGGLEAGLGLHAPVMISDLVGSSEDAVLASPYAAATVRNNGKSVISVLSVEATHNACIAELVLQTAIKLMPGQTRPIAFRLACVTPISQAPLFGRIIIDLKYRVGEGVQVFAVSLDASPQMRDVHEPHKLTYLHPGGIVSYAVLRPPSRQVKQEVGASRKLPVMLALHGAGVEADSPLVAHALDPLPDLHAWVLFPSGVTPWSGDDWHTWGFADVESAIAALPDWIQQVDWDGPGIELDKWLVIGHSNGGQGAWYALTHRPDKVIAAAPLSGYSSIQNYVPYTFWHPADPGRAAVVQAALNSYRHELLLGNAKHIPVMHQHGSADDNVPVYNSRLLSQLMHEAGSGSNYVEVVGRPHWWDGVMTTEPLQDFFEQHLQSWGTDRLHGDLDFSVVVANPGDTGSKLGVQIHQLAYPGWVGSVQVSVNRYTSRCSFRTTNVRIVSLPPEIRNCSLLTLDGEVLQHDPSSQSSVALIKENGHWRTDSIPTQGSSNAPATLRLGRQVGFLDAILRTEGRFVIVPHSGAAARLALQVSRNLCQYFAADTEIVENYEEALTQEGNVISMSIGADFPSGAFPTFPIQFESDHIRVRDGYDKKFKYAHVEAYGLGAIFVRGIPGTQRLELVVWGMTEADLDVAVRLVPMMAGVGQPDFVIMDRTMLWKGIDGALAMGFFDWSWQISKNSFLP